jgi:hypothetical protein
MLPTAHRRTAAEAVAQADAKYRIRVARGLRHTGLVVSLVGVWVLVRPRTWAPVSRTIMIARPGGGLPWALSVLAVIGFVTLVGGPVLSAIGEILLRRAVAAARGNPITSGVVDEAMTGRVEPLV